jgi:hypothetical protein
MTQSRAQSTRKTSTWRIWSSLFILLSLSHVLSLSLSSFSLLVRNLTWLKSCWHKLDTCVRVDVGVSFAFFSLPYLERKKSHFFTCTRYSSSFLFTLQCRIQRFAVRVREEWENPSLYWHLFSRSLVPCEVTFVAKAISNQSCCHACTFSIISNSKLTSMK